MAKFLDLEGLNYFWEKIKSWVLERFAYKSDLNQKLDKLRSGQNIKTINNLDILGLGNIEIQSGGAVDSVNGKTGDVVLDAEDVNALPKSTTIPTKVSDLTNDSSFSSVSIDRKVSTGTNIADITIDGTTTLLYAPEGSGSITIDNELSTTSENPVQNKVITQTLNEKADLDDIPDVSNFITNTVNNLTNYYLKSETYTKDEVAALIGAIQQFHYEIYPTLPQSGESNVLYLIGPTGSGADKYEEYVYSNNAFTKIGDTSIDLSGYVTTSALNTALQSYTPTSQLAAVATSGSYNDLEDKPTIPDVSGKEDSSNKVSIIAGYETNTTKYPNTKAVADYAQTIGNKVTTFQSTPDNTHYPSEKLVKDSLDTKIDNTDVEALTAVDVDNAPTANSSNLVTSGGVYTVIAAKQNKPTITSVSSSTLTQEIADNTIYNAGELSALTITLPNTINADFISEIDFTSGSTATALTAPNIILWAGDDLNSNVFVPAASKRYTVMFYSDGVSVRGVVQGFATS